MTDCNSPCPLCGGTNTNKYFEDKKRVYLQCNTCHLVFVPSQYYLSSEEEKAEYDKHQNSLEDEGYLRFLSRMIEPIVQRVSAPASGLDYGCGPAPALAKVMVDEGYDMATYDLYYQPDTRALKQKYDFVTCTEVIEHIAKPRQLLPRLFNLVRPNGYLGFMTKLVIDQTRFQTWHYKNDPTHICFYSKSTFEFIARQYQLELEFVASDVILLKSK